MDARLIPCRDETMRQLSFKKDTHVKLLLQCLSHIKGSNNDVSHYYLSPPQNWSSPLCQLTACPSQPISAQQEEAFTGNQKPTQVWEDQTVGTNVLTLQLTTAIGSGGGVGTALLVSLCGG